MCRGEEAPLAPSGICSAHKGRFVSPEEQGQQRKAAQKELSDMDYLKSKMVRAQVSSSSEDEDEDSEDEAVHCDGGSETEEEDSPATPVQQESRAAVPGSQRPQVAAGSCVCVERAWAGLGQGLCSPLLRGVTWRKGHFPTGCPPGLSLYWPGEAACLQSSAV